jgi:hypothetical protein
VSVVDRRTRKEWRDRADAEFPPAPRDLVYADEVIADLAHMDARLRREAAEILDQLVTSLDLPDYKGEPALKPLSRVRDGDWRLRFGVRSIAELDDWRIVVRPSISRCHVEILTVRNWRATFLRVGRRGA